ncbi:MAG: cohesin domain-containing protein [Candidatus Poribacteria bacterium]|nr:cohesin domain-containing protein [Candidatus Poribacteria bacterium]MDE0505599.1 cohesin domain-containing protein [Candidatus Poribacteria bacterium]
MKNLLVLLALFVGSSVDTFAQIHLPEGATQRIGKGAIWEIAYSPDGKYLAVASSIGTWLYNSRTGSELALLTGHSYGATSIAFSPDGQTLATGGDWPDRTIRLWDTATGVHKRTLDVIAFDGRSLAFSPDGKTLAGATYDRKVRLWNAATGTPILTLEGHTSSISSAAFSPDGRTLASGSQDDSVRLWDIATQKEKLNIAAHGNNVTSVAFSPDGRMLVSSSYDGTVRLWDAATGDLQRLLGRQTGVIDCVAFSPDGRTLASGGEDGAVRVWDVMTGALERTIDGHSSWVKSLDFSPDGRTLASGGWDSTIRFWNTATGNHRRTIEGHTGVVWSIAFSPDGHSIASGNGNPFPWIANNHIRILDTLTGGPQQTLEIPDHPWIQSVAYSPDGRLLASGGGRDIQVWDVATGAQRQTLKGHRRSVYGLAFSPDGQTLASASDDKTARLWDASTGTNDFTLEGHTVRVNSVVFSPNGRTLASGSDDHTIRLWDTITGAHLATLRGHRDDVEGLAFSPDGRTLASGNGGKIHLWDTATTTIQQTLDGHRGQVKSIAFSPDGRSLAGGSWQNVHLWDVMTGGRKRILKGHKDWVNGVAFSPDGQTLASGSGDGTILLWEFNPTVNLNAVANAAPTALRSLAVGAQFTIALNVRETDNVAGYQATLRFDPTAVRFVANTNGDYFVGDDFAAPPAVEENSVTIVTTSLAGVNSGAGTLASLTFEVVAFRASSLTLSDVILVAPNGERYFPHIENREILVESPDATGIAGDVNRDGVLDLQDLELIGSNLGQMGQNNADVNGDGIVDIVDLVKVAGRIADRGEAAPASLDVQSSLSATDVKLWLELSKSSSLTDATLQRGIHMLESLLATLNPKETLLLPNYPNPFNPETWIPYHLASDSDVVITIYDVNGMLVRQLNQGDQQAGFYTDKGRAAYWDGRSVRGESVASGTYFYQLHTRNFSAMRRMVIVK